MATFVGQLDNMSIGYAQAGLNYLMALYSVQEPIWLMPVTGMTNWRLLPKWADPLSYWTGKTGTPTNVGFLHHTPDTLTSLPMAAQVNIGITTLETSRVPRWIIEDLNDSHIPCLVVPSQFNKEQFEKSGYEKEIHVVPHTIGKWWWETKVALEKDRPFTFYYVGGWNNRKNPESVLKAYLKAFPTQQEDAALALKITGGKSVENYIAQIIKEYTGKASRDDIWIWVEQWGEGQVQWLHNFGDVFVSAHRGEGFGLGPFQAKLLGNECIATGWSAPIEYLSEQTNDILLPYELVPVEGMDQGQHHFRTSRSQKLMWAEPNEDALVSAMLQKYKEGRKQKTFDGIDEFRNKYEWSTIGNMLKDVLDKYR